MSSLKKLKPPLKHKAILLFMIFCLITNLSAYTKDNDQQLIIKSKQFKLNYKDGYAFYSGDVKLNQGSRELLSDKLYIYFDKKNSALKNNQVNNKIKEIKAVGNPVSYTESLDSINDRVMATANTIKLDPVTSILTLDGNANIKYSGKRLTSDLLHYNIKNEVAYAPKVENKRTKLILGKK